MKKWTKPELLSLGIENTFENHDLEQSMDGQNVEDARARGYLHYCHDSGGWSKKEPGKGWGQCGHYKKLNCDKKHYYLGIIPVELCCS